ADLALRLAVEVTHAEHDPLARRESSQRRASALEVVAGEHLALDRRLDLGACGQKPAYDRPATKPITLELAKAAVGGHAVQPAVELLAIVEGRELVEQGHEHVLSHVLGPGFVAKAVAQRDAKHRAMVPTIEPIEDRGLIAATLTGRRDARRRLAHRRPRKRRSQPTPSSRPTITVERR